ncbi:AAA family ATPase [Mycobacterium intracellulare]|uniref:AAA family ATPase n=1 Tax=Mycobacterium intracellulare TaxID=1767 RepID=UPI0022B76211|nr:AAA family ATPase [Mycobacterium intracellulare]
MCPLSAPAGAGKTTSLRALASAARRFRGQVIVIAPTGKAVDVAVREGRGMSATPWPRLSSRCGRAR